MGIPESITKSYPGNYPADAIAILDAMCFTDGKGLKILGSMSLRSQQYAGDYDGYEVVKMDEESDEKALDKLAAKFKVIIKRLSGMKDVYIGDCKSGVIEEWRILPRSAKVVGERVEGYNAVASRKKVDELSKAGVITREEAKSALELLKPSLTPVELIIAKGKLKFHLVRWTPQQILEGKQTLRDKRVYTLQEAFSSPTISKLDVIGLVQRNRFTDFSVIYEFHNKGKVLNPDEIDIAASLEENILFYEAENNPFKVLKRRFALAKFKGDDETVKKLTGVLNSDLGRVYHVLGDIGTLITLLDEHSNQPMEKIRYEIDQFKNRLANVYTLDDYLKREPTILGQLNAALKTPSKGVMLARLEEVERALEGVLNKHTPDLVGGRVIALLKTIPSYRNR
jgi:hypothetical protein